MWLFLYSGCCVLHIILSYMLECYVKYMLWNGYELWWQRGPRWPEGRHPGWGPSHGRGWTMSVWSSIGISQHAFGESLEKYIGRARVECGPARQTSAAPKIVPVANPTTGNSSTVQYITRVRSTSEIYCTNKNALVPKYKLIRHCILYTSNCGVHELRSCLNYCRFISSTVLTFNLTGWSV